MTSTITDLLLNNHILSALFAVGVSAALANLIAERFATAPDRRRDEARKRLHQNIAEKLKAGVSLTVNDILNIGKGMGVPRSEAIDTIYTLLAEAKEQKDIETARHLLDDVNKKAPYEDLPDEVKPAIIRLSEICEAAKAESDKALLIPVQQALSRYKVMLGDHQRMKTQSRISYIVGIISVIVGLVGIALAFRSPPSADVRQTINDVISTHTAPNNRLEGTGDPQTARQPPQP